MIAQDLSVDSERRRESERVSLRGVSISAWRNTELGMKTPDEVG